MNRRQLIFKVADQPWEFEQIDALNYRTFVEEIPQHSANDAHALRDKFHQQNTYIICLDGRTLIAMAAVRDQRPFSLDLKLNDLDAYLPPHQRPCEVRLLAAEKSHRHTPVFAGLLERLVQYCVEREYDIALISGTVRQLRLYRHMGFVPFGPIVGRPEAPYQPMYVTAERLKASLRVPLSNL